MTTIRISSRTTTAADAVAELRRTADFLADLDRMGGSTVVIKGGLEIEVDYMRPPERTDDFFKVTPDSASKSAAEDVQEGTIRVIEP